MQWRYDGNQTLRLQISIFVTSPALPWEIWELREQVFVRYFRHACTDSWQQCFNNKSLVITRGKIKLHVSNEWETGRLPDGMYTVLEPRNPAIREIYSDAPNDEFGRWKIVKCSVRSKLRPDQLVHTSLYTHTHTVRLFFLPWQNGNERTVYL